MLVCVLYGAGRAEVGDSLSPDKVPAPVRQRVEVYRTLGLEILGYVQGPGNLTGAVVRMPEDLIRRVPGMEVFAQGGFGVFFLSPDGRQMVIGLSFDLEKGSELVRTLVAKYEPAPRVAQGIQLEGLSEKDLAVQFVETGREGADGRYYCFIDLRCPHSRKQLDEMKKLDAVVRWVPITLGDPISTTRASYLLALDHAGEKDLEEAMTRTGTLHEAAWMFTEEEKQALAAGVLVLEKNVSFATGHGIRSTPVCASVREGKVVRVYRGVFDAGFIKNNH
jgi:hypothetical protein